MDENNVLPITVVTDITRRIELNDKEVIIKVTKNEIEIIHPVVSRISFAQNEKLCSVTLPRKCYETIKIGENIKMKINYSNIEFHNVEKITLFSQKRQLETNDTTKLFEPNLSEQDSSKKRKL